MTPIDNMVKYTIEDLKEAVEFLMSQKMGVCYKKVAETDGGTGLYIVLGWGGGFAKAVPGNPSDKWADQDEPTYRICAKVAYARSTAYCGDYDDFSMPYNEETGLVDDTDSAIPPRLTKAYVASLNRTARRVWKEWRNDLDNL